VVRKLLHFFLKRKILRYEKAMAAATDRKSFYQEEAVGVGGFGRAQKAFHAGQHSAAIDECYALLLRFHDYSSVYHLLARCLERVGEKQLAYINYKRALKAFRETMNGIDDECLDDFIRLAEELGHKEAAISFVEGLAGRDAKARKRLEVLRHQGRL